jgi:hypothetical protein
MFRAVTLVLVVSSSMGVRAAAQEPAAPPPGSLERIGERLKTTTAPSRFDTPLQQPVATFRTSVEGRSFVLTLEEQIRKDFTLNDLQRQSADWASKCCGINLNQLFQSAERALHRRKVRRIREQIARELAELEAARQK